MELSPSPTLQYLADTESRYIQSLQARHKWTKTQRNYQVGDIVLLKDKSLLGPSWQMAVIIQIHPEKDRLIRVVDLKTRGKIIDVLLIASCCSCQLEMTAALNVSVTKSKTLKPSYPSYKQPLYIIIP